MNSLFKIVGSILLTLVFLLFSSVDVFANSPYDSEESLQGLDSFFSFALLLLMIIGPAFKKRERTMFVSNNNELLMV